MKMWVVLAAVSLALVGCGGGSPAVSGSSGSSGSGGSTPATAATVTLTLSSNTVTSANPATVTARVLSASGASVPGVVVTFSVNAAIGALSSSAALTDSSGIASVTLSPAATTTTGADNITASVAVSAGTLTASRGYQLSATNAAFTSFATSSGTSTTSKLAAYGQAVLTITMSGVSSASPVTLNLTSACVSAGKATISPSTLNNSSGRATFTYKDAGGCGSILAADTITASVTGATTSDTLQVYLTAPTANSITFSSATPNIIYLKGSGYVESSTVKFQVVDTAGNALPGQPVSLVLASFAGGLLLNQGTSPVTQTSDSNGFVSVIVNSGTVPTPVRVIATLPSGVNTVSSNLVVVTGLPSQLNFSLSEATINIEGWEYDGRPNTYTVYAADRSGNPVPDGTSILFWAEGGQIQGSASTFVSGGISSATASFVSASPKPADGRVTVLAYAIGEESFVDLAGTNVYAQNDPYMDLGNVVKSKLYDGQYDPQNDEIVSLSGLGSSSSGGSACDPNHFSTTYPQFALNNSIPNQPGTCDGGWSSKTYVRKDLETVFSSVTPNPLFDASLLTQSCKPFQIYRWQPTISGSLVNVYPYLFTDPSTGLPAGNQVLYVGPSNSGSFQFLASDKNPKRINPMAAGTTITASPNDTQALSSASVPSGSFIYTSTSSAQPVTVNYTFASKTDIATNVTTVANSGVLTLKFVSQPSGTTTQLPLTIVRSYPSSICQ